MSEVRLYFKNAAIRDDGEFLCLTDMWRAAGADESKRPAEWLRHDATQEFASYLETVGHAHSLVRTVEGRGGATWAHWQLGMAYAKYLSPAFHAWCNDVVRAVMQGRSAPPVHDTESLARAVVAHVLATVDERLGRIEANQAALWGHISQGGYIARARFEALRAEWQELADLEVAVGRWPDRRSALADIQRDMREAADWGGKGKPWAELPAAEEPAVRAVLRRRRKDALRRSPPPKPQLSLIKVS